ncbi:MAG TPA: TIGR02206 family membrane protein [Actinophytocola sp.]|uniref:YwaF family protein n=1 Tax=Actinophytocola sp. TaxID=1872138 RepID=UPI002DB828FB|nr:TIGR02206 family membrane protein [Actinophytocola sp.]HEU5473934.1 TIGR02206 family membrane protein [Actinophytocola sp.]
MRLAQREFSLYGASHWAVLAVFVAGAIAVSYLGRWQDAGSARRFSRVLAVPVLGIQIAIQVYSMTEFGVDHGLPLQLSDLAAFVTAYALWTHRHWAFSLTYYWGLTLSTQALISPALRGADFPSLSYLAFWLIHLLVIWAALYLAVGRRMRPTWHGYRFTLVVTFSWVGFTMAFNAVAGTNYGFLNAKPGVPSVLDVLGPWPWYLVPLAALVTGIWALMTLPGVLRRQRS